LYGGDDDDRISGGEGNDLAYGGQGSDVFAHTAQAGGNLRIGDFTAGEDRIDLTAFEITYEDLVSMMTDDGTNIDLGDDRSIFLENVDEEDLNEDMFIF
jgi:Ca2+-binding RTX toxin-like protein